MAYSTKQQGCLHCLFFTVILEMLCIILYPLLTPSEKVWFLGDKHSYMWLEYTAADGNPGDECNCSAILQGDSEALGEANLLKITHDFKRSVPLPDEYYIGATQNCRYGSVKQLYVCIWIIIITTLKCNRMWIFNHFQPLVPILGHYWQPFGKNRRTFGENRLWVCRSSIFVIRRNI